MKTNTYVLSEEWSVGPYNDRRVLPIGTFVRPIDHLYVPQHCFKHPAAGNYDRQRDIFVYCRYGMFPVPRKCIRRLD